MSLQQASFLYISLSKLVENQQKWSLGPPGQIPLHFLIKTYGKSLEMEPGGIQGSFLYISLVKPVEHQQKQSLSPPGQGERAAGKVGKSWKTLDFPTISTQNVGNSKVFQLFPTFSNFFPTFIRFFQLFQLFQGFRHTTSYVGKNAKKLEKLEKPQ